jgi:methylase of polypeptide subunit release factors
MLLIEGVETGSRLNYNRLSSAPLSPDWGHAPHPEPKIHSIHVYPAKFPAFILQKAIDYAALKGVEVKRVGDIFCGSGTIACEARTRNLEFWGCDISPIATLIARAKGTRPDLQQFEAGASRIADLFDKASPEPALSQAAIARLRPWFTPKQFGDLAKLRNAIELETCEGHETRMLFDCAFSAIVKPASQWRARSMKPSMDLTKKPASVLQAFQRQCRLMTVAWSEAVQWSAPSCEIIRGDVNEVQQPSSPVDLIITSPPYATSYEYADLHQLSALWLNYADDHRLLRRGVIGTASRRSSLSFAMRHLNAVGMQIVFSLFDKDRALAEALATYFLDMQKVVRRCREFLAPDGICVFVVGNTQFKGVRIDNANHMVESLIDAGFGDIRVLRRPVTNKLNTPYRLPNGRLSSTPTSMGIYAEEYIVMAQRR